MVYPDIKTYHQNRRQHRFASLAESPNFLGQDALDVRWDKSSVPANIKRENELYVLELALPGFKKEELEINVIDDLLIVRAIRKEEKAINNTEYILKEYGTEVRERRFKLYADIGHEQIQAQYENGILTLRFTDVAKDNERLYKRIKVT